MAILDFCGDVPWPKSIEPRIQPSCSSHIPARGHPKYTRITRIGLKALKRSKNEVRKLPFLCYDFLSSSRREPLKVFRAQMGNRKWAIKGVLQTGLPR